VSSTNGVAPQEEPFFSSDEPEMSAGAEKTNNWAGIFFSGAAMMALTVASYYIYCSWKEWSPSLLIPALVWALVATIIGTAGEILDNKPKVETITGDRRTAFLAQAPAAFVRGKPVPIINVGNTCFINALTQGLMNDDELLRVFKEICTRARDRHRVFSAFLSLFSSQTILPAWVPRIWEFKKNEAPLLAVENMRDVLAMLDQRKSDLKFGTQGFTDKYPHMTELIHQFSLAQREADFPIVDDADEKLRQEFTHMKNDPTITTFFSTEQDKVAKRIAGFEAYLNLIISYERALQHEPHTVSLGGDFFSSHSSIENIRNLFQRAGAYSQEDAAELVDCLVQYIRPGDYPEAFISLIRQKVWVECSEQLDKVKLATLMERHNAATGPNDQLTQLDDHNITRSLAEPCCILRIQDVLSKNANGQELLDQALGVRAAQADPKESAVFLKNGEAKFYYASSEQLEIEKLPARFILQLMRFQWNGTIRQKVDCDVNMPLEIKMKGEGYELKSVVVHHGTNANSGHYTAMLKKTIEGESTWWLANDGHVTSEFVEKDMEKALKQGYLYFYVKKAAAGV
jgi:hypothetical protein